MNLRSVKDFKMLNRIKLMAGWKEELNIRMKM